MSRFLPEGLARASRLLEGTSAQTAALFAALTAAVVLAGSAISYWFARDLARNKELAAMTVSTEDEAERLAERLGAFSQLIATLAADEAIAAAVVDSEGRNRHLRPVLRLMQPTLDRQFSAQASGGRIRQAVVAVLDYRGRPLVGSIEGLEAKLSLPEGLERAMRGTPVVRFDAARHVLYVAHPVVFGATAQAEGIALGILEISEETLPSKRSQRWRETLALQSQAGPPTNAASTSVTRPLPLPPPLSALPLALTMSIPDSALDAEARAILRPHLVVAVIGMLLAALAGVGVAQRTSRPLRRLAEEARVLSPAQAGRSFAAVAAGGTREVRQLGRSLDEALGALRESTATARLAKAALDAASEGIVIVDMTDPAMPATYVNRAYGAITGYGPEEVIGRNCRFLHAQDPAQPALDTLRHAIRTGQTAQVVLRNWRKDGSPFWNELGISPVYGAQGRVTHYIGILKDVSERIRNEEHVRASQKLESLGQLTGGLAHDFNNLLGIVIGNLDLLHETLPEGTPEQARAQTALQAALRGADVTRSLLAVARRQHLEPQDIDVNERIRDLLPLVGNTLGRRVQLHLELTPDTLHALVDGSGFDTAILNFAINARDAMAETGGELRLSTCALELPAHPPEPEYADLPAGKYVRIEIADNGCGMPPEVRARAFEPFFTTKPTGRGTGLGLSMVYGFARQSGGTAVLREAPGGGTIAALILPAAAGPAAA